MVLKARHGLWIGIAALLLFLGSVLVKTLMDAGEFKTIIPHDLPSCQVVRGVLSSEDITIHPVTGLAFLSSDDRRPLFGGESGIQGAILGYDLNAQDPKLVNLTTEFSGAFHPHGIGLWIGEGGKASLFAVNHTKHGHFVEIFDLEGGRLIHRESVASPLMHSPNDVFPTGARSFYVTNDHGAGTGLGRVLEEYLQLAGAYVLHFDGREFRKVAEGLAYANGIAASLDGRKVYVAATVGRGIAVYTRDPVSNALTFETFIAMGTGVDNIEVDKDGNLWVGAHPKLLTFVKYSKDPEVSSPSQVLKVVPKGKGFIVTEIYASSGRPLSGSSVAAVYKDTLLIGSVLDDRFLRCRIP